MGYMDYIPLSNKEKIKQKTHDRLLFQPYSCLAFR